MNNSIVLGYPYDRAMYWLLAGDWMQEGFSQPYHGTHPYYKTLYGKANDRLVNETVSLSILFDKIYLAAADTRYPDMNKYYDAKKSSYINKELGLLSDWRWYGDRKELNEITEHVLRDNFIKYYLRKVPTQPRYELVERTIVQLRVAKKFNANLMGSSRYLHMAKKVKSIIDQEDKNDYGFKGKQKLLTGFDWAFNTKTLTFRIDDLEQFIAIRKEKTLRKYAESFRKHALASDGKKELAKAMISARNTSNIGDKISGIMGIGASILGIPIPLPSPYSLASVGGLGLDIASKVIEAHTKNEWYSFAPRVYQAMDFVRIEKEAKAAS